MSDSKDNKKKQSIDENEENTSYDNFSKLLEMIEEADKEKGAPQQEVKHMFIYRDGNPSDTMVTIDIKNYGEAKNNAAVGPYVDVNVTAMHRDLKLNIDASVDWDELDDLLITFEKFMNKGMDEYCVWDHIEGDLEIHFNPKEDEVLLKIYFSPSGTHMSGIFVEMYSKDEYTKFYEYLSSVIKI